MRLLSIDLFCDKCETTYDDIVDYEERNNSFPCKSEGCDGLANRTYAAMHVSTAKLSKSLPDCVGEGRFSAEIEQNHLRRDLTSARTQWSKDKSSKSKEEVTRLKREVEKTKRRK